MDNLEKSVEIIEFKNPEDCTGDMKLVRMYEEDKEYVVNILRKRLREGRRERIAGDILASTIKKDYLPVIKMLEEEIDNGNYEIQLVGEHILLEDFFPSKKEWLDWCKKWRDDKRKRKIILCSLWKILTELMNYQYSTIREEAIALVKEFARKKGISYERENKKISLGRNNYKEITIKALNVIEKLLFPPVQIDIETLKENLKNYPYLCKAVDADWLVRNAQSENPHLLAYIYGQKVNKTNKLRRNLILNAQLYWERIFKTLDKHGLKIPKSKLRDSENAKSILTEIEVIARLVPYFKVEIEPDIPELSPKKLDAKIEFNGQNCLIEIAFVKETIESKLSYGVTVGEPGSKIKNVLLTKFKKQLKKGKSDPRIPIVLVLCLDDFLGSSYEVENAIYGQLQFYVRTDTKQIIKTRAKNSFYEIEGTDIVSAIAAYVRDYSKNDSLVGKLYQPPASINPRNPLTKELRVRLRDALFGESECSNWRSLLKIEGIDEEIAKKLHAGGIEDLGALAMAKDEDLIIKGFDVQKMKEFRQEARRIIKDFTTKCKISKRN